MPARSASEPADRKAAGTTPARPARDDARRGKRTLKRSPYDRDPSPTLRHMRDAQTTELRKSAAPRNAKRADPQARRGEGIEPSKRGAATPCQF